MKRALARVCIFLVVIVATPYAFGDSKKKEKYAVYRIAQLNVVEFVALNRDGFEKKKEELKKWYEEAISSYAREREDLVRIGHQLGYGNVTVEQPKPPSIQKIKTFSDLQEAEKFAEELREKYRNSVQ